MPFSSSGAVQGGTAGAAGGPVGVLAGAITGGIFGGGGGGGAKTPPGPSQSTKGVFFGAVASGSGSNSARSQADQRAALNDPTLYDGPTSRLPEVPQLNIWVIVGLMTVVAVGLIFRKKSLG